MHITILAAALAFWMGVRFEHWRFRRQVAHLLDAERRGPVREISSWSRACWLANTTTISVFPDGDQFTAVYTDTFENLQESPAGFGSTQLDAVAALLAEEHN